MTAYALYLILTFHNTVPPSTHVLGGEELFTERATCQVVGARHAAWLTQDLVSVTYHCVPTPAQ